MQPTLFDDVMPPKAKARHKLAVDADDWGVLDQWRPMLLSKVDQYPDLSPDDRADYKQEVWHAALRAFGTFNAAKGYTIQTHIGFAAECRLKTIHRKRVRRGFTGTSGTPPDLTTIPETFDAPDTRAIPLGATVEQLRAAFDLLPHDEYLVIVHRRISEMTGAEVAALLGTTVDEVDRIEAAAMERLASLLGG